MAPTDSQDNTEPKGRDTSNERPAVWSHALIAILISTAGIIAAFAVVAWTMGIEPGQRNRTAVVSATHDSYVAVLNTRIADLEQQVKQLAGSSLARDALLSGEPVQIQAAESNLESMASHVHRIVLTLRGEAEADLSAAVPITFAALDVILTAESAPYAGPEASLSQRELIYAAAPVTAQGRVIGVLFAAVDRAFFTGALANFDAASGRMEVEQRFSGTEASIILQHGSEGQAEGRMSTVLAANHWTLSFSPSAQLLPELFPLSGLLAPLALCLAVVLGGIYLAFSRHSRKLGEDLAVLGEYATKLIRGRGANLDRYHISPVQNLAVELSQVERPAPAAAAAPAPQAVRENQAKIRAAEKRVAEAPPVPETNVDDLLGEVNADSAEQFLEVEDTGGKQEDNFGIEVDENVSPLELGLELDEKIFRAYDIRGITTENLTEEVVYWIGRAFAAEALAAGQNRVAIGRDGRLSSAPLRDELERGLNEGGADTVDIGMVPTPLLYYATHELGTGTGIMITGSHNPPEYNGLKMMIGGTTLAEERIQQLLKRIQNNDLSEGQGQAENVPINDHYIDRIVGDVALAQSVRVVIDAGNGVAGAIAPRLIESLGCEVIPLYCDVDGNFPNHHPDPAEPHNLEDLITVVQAEGADIGLAFDGDGDRLGVVTNTGEIIWPDKLMMLFSQDIVGRNPGADIIYDVKCSRHLNTLISEYGGRPIMWKTGHSHIKAKIKETGALLAGEFSGHICFGERWYGFDDALYSAARLLEIVSSENQNVDDLFAQFPVTFTTPELKINTTEERKFEVMDQLAEQADFGDGTVTTIDGLRVDYADGWGLIRPSNTSPVLSLRFEADGQSALTRIQDIFAAQLAQIDPTLSFRT